MALYVFVYFPLYCLLCICYFHKVPC